jgi:heme exporter protein B
MEWPGLGTAFWLQLTRDLRLAFRHIGQAANPLMFFVMVTTLFPLALSPAPELLMAIAPGRHLGLGAAGLAAGRREPVPAGHRGRHHGAAGAVAPALSLLLLAKTTSHWLMTGLPLVLMAPVVGHALFLPAEAVPATMLALLLATPVLSLAGAVMAALTVGLRRGGGLLSLLILPIVMPVLIFGARATDMAMQGLDVTGVMYLLAAVLLLAVSLAPAGMAAAMRISLD